MKHPLFFVIAFLLTGLIVGCAPTASGGAPVAVTGAPTPGLEQTSAPPADSPELTATVTPTSAATPTPESPAPATQSIATHTPAAPSTATPVPSPSTATPAPTNTPPAAPTSAPQDGANQEELVGYGLEVYKGQYCGVCHQLGAAETAGKFGPAHDGMRATAEQRVQDPGYAGQATTAGEYIRESILSPKAYIVPGYEVTSHHMPAYTHLEEGDINALVQMLLHQE